MLYDSFTDFVLLSEERRANLPALLDELETDLNYYASKEWGHNPKIFPLLRKVARGYVTGKLSRQVLEAVSNRTILCYLGNEGSEAELIKDLSDYLRAKPSIDLCALVAEIVSRNRAAAKEAKKQEDRSPDMPHLRRKSAPAKQSTRTATTSTGVVLRLVN